MPSIQRVHKDAPDLKSIIRHNYNALARHYNWLMGIYEWLGVARLRRRLLSHAQGQVLEIAVGTGKNLRYYPRNADLLAVDFSVQMVRQAQRQARRLGRPVRFALMDAEQLSFPDDSFDTVVCTFATGTFPTPTRALNEMRRVVRPGGRVLMIEHAYSNKPLLRRLQDLWGDKQFAWLGNRWRYEPIAVAEQAKLQPEAVHRTFFGILHSMVLRPAKSQPTPQDHPSPD